MRIRGTIVTLSTLVALGALAPSPSSAQPVTAEREASADGQQAHAYFSPISASVPSLGRAVRRNDGADRVVAWLDLTEGPLVLSALDPPPHYVVPMLDQWAGVALLPGGRVTGTRADQFLVALSVWQGPLPAGITRLDSPTPHVWIIGHPEIDVSPHHDGVRRTTAGYRIVPLSEWRRPSTLSGC